MTVEIEEGGTFDPDESLVLLDEGRYQCRYDYYETRPRFGMGRPKVVLHFSVVHPPEYHGIPLQRFYNVKRLKCEPKRGGGFVPPSKGDLVRDMERLFGRVDRRDRLAIGKNFRSRDWTVKVRTVDSDSKGGLLPEASRYSVIESIIGPAPDSSPRRSNPSAVPTSIPTHPVLDDLPF